MSKAELCEQFFGPRAWLTATGDLDGQPDVLHRGEEWDQVVALEHYAYASRTKARSLDVAEGRDVLAVEEDLAGVGQH
jgi:hypothetical protein